MNEKAQEKLEELLGLIDEKKEIDRKIADILGESEEEEDELPPPNLKKGEERRKERKR